MILRYCGVDDVRVLDGGYDWWVRAGNPLETVIREPTPVSSFSSRWWQDGHGRGVTLRR